MSILVSFKSKAPLREIDGTTYCLWEYQITNSSKHDDITADFRELRRQLGLAEPSGAASTKPKETTDQKTGGQVGLGFSKRLDIKNPSQYPDVNDLKGTRLEKPADDELQYIFTDASQQNTGTIEIYFIAPCAEDSFTPVTLTTIDTKGERKTPPFRVNPDGMDNTVQVTRGPALVSIGQPPGPNRRPVTDFIGTLPYASEVFGVYQPLAGWFGRSNAQRVIPALTVQGISTPLDEIFSGSAARTLSHPMFGAMVNQLVGASPGVLSPVGLVTLFREYFFEFDTFLGAPAGHLWISPGGTIEVIEGSTRRTLVEKTASQSEDTTRKTEETLTSQEDVADAVKEDNANDIKLGASASAGANFAGIYHADASASFSTQNTTHKSSEETHKHTRTQSSKVSSEIHRNFKTTFKTVTETTDITSRRYVVQNTTDKLVNYELRRKMRKVGVQVQHIGTKLSWQAFVDMPGKELGLGEMVHIMPAPDLSSIKKPEPPPPLQPKDTVFNGAFPIRKVPGTKVDPNINQNFGLHSPGSDGISDYGNEMHLLAKADFVASPPAPDYTLSQVSLVSARSGGGGGAFMPEYPININNEKNGFTVIANFLNTGDLSPLQLTFTLTWQPPTTDPAQQQYQIELTDYNAKVAKLQQTAYAEAVRDRVKVVSGIRPRPSEDLRSEERHSVYGNLIGMLSRNLQLFQYPHLGAELIRQIFDVDEMLYFVAPDYWRPGATEPPPIGATSVGKYPVPKQPTDIDTAIDPLAGNTIVSWYSYTDKNNVLDSQRTTTNQWRINYPITEDSQRAPLGSSLGWLIQIDGDERRNQFLNAAWVKAVLPIRAGHEIEALDWLAQAMVEGEAGLGQLYPFQPGDPPSYQGKTLGEVLRLLATELQATNTDIKNTLATEKVFETGFDPLGTGFRPAEPYQIFDEWIEVLPTDQVVAVEVDYNPKTGKQV